MDRLTRKDLKTDKFAVEVTHTVEYLGEHRQSAMRYGAIALVIVLAAAGWYYWSNHQRDLRQRALGEALQAQNASIGPAPNAFIKSFATQQEKDAAVQKAFQSIVTGYSGSTEAAIANYMLGVGAADKGDLAEAEKRLKEAVDKGGADYGSMANLALSDIYLAQGKTADAEKILRALMAKPTSMVSKDQATIALARVLGSTNSAEALKLLEPMRTTAGATGQAAMNAYQEISSKK